MTMIVSRKQRIFFRYEGERGAFLVLHHGFLGSHEDWYAAGYVAELAKEFRVIVPDARGHGRSDKPAEKEQYGQLQLAEDLIEIMNELGIRNSHFVGYGVGALVGFELLRRFPERVRIAILGGESALVTPAVQEAYRAEAESLKAMSLADYLKALHDQGRLVRTAAAVDEEQERPAALALLEAVSAWEPAPADRIQVASPLTLFYGTEDTAAGRVEAVRSGVSRARLVPFHGFSHARLFHERTHVLEEVLRLLKSGRRDEDERPRGEQGPQGAPPGPGQGDRRRGSGRRDAQRWGHRSSDRAQPETAAAPAGDAAALSGGAGAAQTVPVAHADEPSPIPGTMLNAEAVVAAQVPAGAGAFEPAAGPPQAPRASGQEPGAAEAVPAPPAEPPASAGAGLHGAVPFDATPSRSTTPSRSAEPPAQPAPDAHQVPDAAEERRAADAEEAGWAGEPPPEEVAQRETNGGEPPKE